MKFTAGLVASYLMKIVLLGTRIFLVAGTGLVELKLVNRVRVPLVVFLDQICSRQLAPVPHYR
jgi:hypothetical protein